MKTENSAKHITPPAAKPLLAAGITNRNWFVKYGRKNGLQGLKILMEYLSDDSLKAAQEAFNYIDCQLRHDRIKGKGKYACR